MSVDCSPSDGGVWEPDERRPVLAARRFIPLPKHLEWGPFLFGRGRGEVVRNGHVVLWWRCGMPEEIDQIPGFPPTGLILGYLLLDLSFTSLWVTEDIANDAR